MSDISVKIRNYPNAFAKPTDISKLLASYSVRQPEGNDFFSPPSKRWPFQFGGISGVPLYYSAEEKKVYVDHTDRHTAVIGPTASKKSRLVAMPVVRLLGAAGESMIISDPKAEIYQRTAAYLRDNNYEVKVLNLREPRLGSAWNPLIVPYQFFKAGNIDRAYEFANDIAVNLTNQDKSKKDVFWDNSAGSFFFGLILLLFRYCDEFNEASETVNIGNILKLRNALCTGDGMYHPTSLLWKFAKEDPFIASALIGTIETANETRAGILSVFDQKMRTFAIHPSLLNMLAFNDIEYENLTSRPTAIFLILPDEKTGYHSLVSLFVKQSYEFLIHKAQSMLDKRQEMGVRVNYILDEFSSLPQISDFSAMITAARSRNIRFNLFLQSKQQLRLRYNEDCDTILSNCENWIFLTSRELEFLREISDLCGECGGSPKKPLLSISDLQRFDKDSGEALVLSGRNKPMITNLADIDFFDRGIVRPVEYGTPSARVARNIDIQKNILQWAKSKIPEDVLKEPVPDNDFFADDEFIPTTDNEYSMHIVQSATEEQQHEAVLQYKAIVAVKPTNKKEEKTDDDI